MGAGASADSNLAALSQETVKFDMKCNDINTPRGETAKAEVRRLRFVSFIFLNQEILDKSNHRSLIFMQTNDRW